MSASTQLVTDSYTGWGFVQLDKSTSSTFPLRGWALPPPLYVFVWDHCPSLGGGVNRIHDRDREALRLSQAAKSARSIALIPSYSLK